MSDAPELILRAILQARMRGETSETEKEAFLYLHVRRNGVNTEIRRRFELRNAHMVISFFSENGSYDEAYESKHESGPGPLGIPSKNHIRIMRGERPDKLAVESKGMATMLPLRKGSQFSRWTRHLATVAWQIDICALATAITPCLLPRIGKKGITRLLHKHQAFSDQFISYVISDEIRILRRLGRSNIQPHRERGFLPTRCSLQ